MLQRIKLWLLLILLSVIGCHPVVVDSTPAIVPTETPVSVEVEEDGGVVSVDKPIVISGYVREGQTIVLSGTNFRQGDTIYLNGGPGVLATTLVSEAELHGSLIGIEMPNNYEDKGYFEVVVINSARDETSGVVNVSLTPPEIEIDQTEALSQTETITVSTGIASTDSVATLIEDAPLLCAPISYVQVWAWLEAGSSVVVLAVPGNRPNYDNNYLLVSSADDFSIHGWVHKDSLELNTVDVSSLFAREEENRCYQLSDQQLSMNDADHFWVVTNPGLGYVDIHCAPFI